MLLKNENELERFLRDVIFPLNKNEAYCIMLGARKKYLKSEEKELYNMNGTDMLRRFILKGPNKPSVDTIRQIIYEWSHGNFTDKNGKKIPEHAFTIFLTVNPRSQEKASLDTIRQLTEALYRGATINLESLVKTNLHKNASEKYFMDFDVDIDDGEDREKILHSVLNELGDTKSHVIMTRGGYHILIDKRQIDPKIKNTFYKAITGLQFKGEVEVKNDSMVPLAGCSCGGTIVKML